MKKITKKLLIFALLGSFLALTSFISIEFGNYGIKSYKTIDILNEVDPHPSNSQALTFGTFAGPTDMDPHLCYDTAGGDFISQICEGLYKFDVTDPYYPLLPVLATFLPVVGGTVDKPTLTFNLRQGVIFQDGTPFNAAAAAWNFNRLMYFMNYSGNQYLPAPFNVPLSATSIVSKVFVLFNLDYNDDGIDEPVINHTEVLSTYILRLHLNYPKASFVNLLTFHSCFFHSPTSAQAQGKELAYLTYADDDVLIGTGPFKFQNYFTDIQVKFTGYKNYWRGAPQLDNLTFWIIEDEIALNTAVLTGDIDLYDSPNPNFYDQFEANPNITLLEAGPTVNTEYMGFNGEMVNTTFRRAISYAINYSYLIDLVLLGNGYRLKSPIPEGIPMSNYSFNIATFDRVYAQSIMQSIGYGVGFTTDAEWLAVADAGGWPGTQHWNITVQTEGTTRRDFALLISYYLRYIGLNVPVVQIPFGSIIGCMVSARKQIPMYHLGWAPDYIDPENYITPLYSNTSVIWVETWDHELEMLMLQGELTIDIGERQAIYNEIQRKLVEELYFFVWIATGQNYDVYQNYVHGWIPNAIGRLDFYPIYIELEDTNPPEITIHSPIADQEFGSDPPGFNISIEDESAIIARWYTLGLSNKNFSGLIGTIDKTLWGEQENGPVSITFYAMDESGNIGSEGVTVIKEIPKKEPIISGYELLILIVVIGAALLIFIRKMRKT